MGRKVDEQLRLVRQLANPPERWKKLVLSPEQATAVRKLEAEKLEEAAKQKNAGKILDRAAAIQNGLIPPPWVEKPLKPRKPAARREGARLLSQDQIDRGTAHGEKKLDDPKEKNPRRWRTQRTAAEQITEFLGLPKESAQTVEDQIVIPLFERRGLRKPKK